MGLWMALRSIAGLLAVALAVVAACPAQASTGTPLPVCIARSAPDLTPATAFAQPARFDCSGRQTHYRRGDFLVVTGLLPRTAAGEKLVVRFASMWQDRVTIYVHYADGVVVPTSFDSRTASRQLRLGAIFSLPIPLRAAAPTRLLWHVEGAANLRGVIAGAQLATVAAATRTETMLAALYGAFAGMAIALIVYNLALWGALRQRFQLVYCILVLSLLVYAASSSGALAQLLPMLDNNDRLRINAVSLAGSSILVLAFARSFFEPRVFQGLLRRASNVVMILLATGAGASALLSPWSMRFTDTILTTGYLALIALVPAILWRAWQTRSNYLWLFTLAWGAPICFAGLRIASAFNLMGWSFWLDNSTLISMMLEAMLSSLAIAYRIRVLSRERDEAREQEIAARLLAATDPLTGLLNRRAFLERAIGREGEQRLLLADIDHFKNVNETIGHDGGDEVLRVFARALRASVPADALIARLGGEEFAIIAPAASTLSASAVLDRVRAERMPFDLSVTASIGTCTGPLTREIDWKALYRSADLALFEAKAAGRDRSRDATGLSFAA